MRGPAGLPPSLGRLRHAKQSLRAVRRPEGRHATEILGGPLQRGLRAGSAGRRSLGQAPTGRADSIDALDLLPPRRDGQAVSRHSGALDVGRASAPVHPRPRPAGRRRELSADRRAGPTVSWPDRRLWAGTGGRRRHQRAGLRLSQAGRRLRLFGSERFEPAAGHELQAGVGAGDRRGQVAGRQHRLRNRRGRLADRAAAR